VVIESDVEATYTEYVNASTMSGSFTGTTSVTATVMPAPSWEFTTWFSDQKWVQWQDGSLEVFREECRGDSARTDVQVQYGWCGFSWDCCRGGWAGRL